MCLRPLSLYAVSAPLLVLLVLLPGCSAQKRKIIPVEGKILFTNGKPLPAGTRLIFNPGEGDMKIAKGVTDVNGSFKLVHQSGASGADAGKYTIQLAAPEGDNGSFFRIVPKEYVEGGVLSVEITEGMKPLDLKVRK